MCIRDSIYTACRAHWHAPAHRPQPIRKDTHAHAHQHAATPLTLSNMHASKHILADRPVLSHIRQRLVEGHAFSFHQVGTDAAHAAADLIHISCIGRLYVRVRDTHFMHRYIIRARTRARARQQDQHRSSPPPNSAPARRRSSGPWR